MSARVALIKHDRPRILAVDFSTSDVNKIKNLGYNVRLGYTGKLAPGQYSIPWAIQDIEVMIADVSPDTFSRASERSMHDSSIEEGPYFKALVQELWNKQGWVILFIQQNCSPIELESLGINNIGVFSVDREFIPRSQLRELLAYWKTKGKSPTRSFFPKFKGEAVTIFSDHKETKILQRHLHAAKMSILAGDTHVGLEGVSYSRAKFLIADESTGENGLAVRISWGQKGTILLLPDFGRNNIDVATAILQEVIAEESPSLFDAPQHSWLKDYLPYPAVVIRKQKEALLAAVRSKLEQLNQKEEQEIEQFEWLLGLLTSTGDEFRDNAAAALRFLGFDVEIVDETITPGEPLKEDLHIIDPSSNFFAIGETKSTRRGASESFITDIQNHQGRFSRENRVPIPNAILIVNHSVELNPSLRSNRFYQNPDLVNRCKAQAITSIDSTALFSMCQSILQEGIDKETVRQHIQQGHGIISQFDANALADQTASTS